MSTDQTFGPWQVKSLLGEGAFGEVYACVHTDDPGCRAAVKVLKPDLSRYPALRKRFESEASMLRTLGRTPHPHVTAFLGHEEARDDAPAWVALELVDGVEVRDVLEDLRRPDGRVFGGDPRSRLDFARAVGLAVARAAAHAHAVGIVHRDIKPENVMMDGTGRLVLVDFGVSRDARASRQTGEAAKSPHTPVYAAPEILRNEAIAQRWESRVDVYALGVTLYEILTGQTPGLPMAEGADGSKIHLPRARPLAVPEVYPPWVVALVREMTAPEARHRPDMAGVEARFDVADADTAPEPSVITPPTLAPVDTLETLDAGSFDDALPPVAAPAPPPVRPPPVRPPPVVSAPATRGALPILWIAVALGLSGAALGAGVWFSQAPTTAVADPAPDAAPSSGTAPIPVTAPSAVTAPTAAAAPIPSAPRLSPPPCRRAPSPGRPRSRPHPRLLRHRRPRRSRPPPTLSSPASPSTPPATSSSLWSTTSRPIRRGWPASPLRRSEGW